MASVHVARVSCLLVGAAAYFSPGLALAQGDPTAAPPPPADAATAAPAAPAAAPAKPEDKGDDGEGDPKTRPAPNSIYLEGLGAGLWYSINYERRVIDDLGVRVGLSYISLGASVSTQSGSTSASASLLTFPITASYLGIRSGKHALELGGGVSVTYATATASNSFGSSASGSGVGAFGDVIVGYRLHPVGRAGFNFRIGAMALIGKGFNVFGDDPTAVGVLPFGYLSLGASF